MHIKNLGFIRVLSSDAYLKPSFCLFLSGETTLMLVMCVCMCQLVSTCTTAALNIVIDPIVSNMNQ